MGPAGEQDAGGASFRFDDPTGGILDFADTAALIANMDLVISVDTAVAHLAGAMGKPAWTLLQYAPDWRWYPDAPTSSWYPGMRLYRQRVPGDWEGVCADVARDLDRLAAGAPAISRT
jgi:ADP-heptose:LPS heptosyltransferase